MGEQTKENRFIKEGREAVKEDMQQAEEEKKKMLNEDGSRSSQDKHVELN